MRASYLVLLSIIAAASLAACERKSDLNTLPALGAARDQVSVSGISSGAYMAGQFEMAEAKRVSGAAIIAGGPYGCSESVWADVMPGPGAALLNVQRAVNGCMLNSLSAWGVADPARLADKARQRAADGEIGAIADVVTDRVYLFSGKNDRTVVPAIVAAAADFYRRLGVPETSIKTVTDMPAGHAFITESEGLACEKSDQPYVVDCDYDQAGSLLKHIYGDLKPPSTQPAGAFLKFDQTEFYREYALHGLDFNGTAYVPNECRDHQGCRVHVAFHGCAQNHTTVGDAFTRQSGFARWADTNRFVILFPQTATTPINPQGCWDWWGYTGRDYLTKSAPQIVAVTRMLDRLADTPSR